MLTMKHRYVDSVGFTGTSGGLALASFNCNSLFKPNNTSAGHQAMYFDNMKVIYDHYTVIGSIIKATFSLNSSASSPATVVGILQNDDATVAPLSYQSALENSRSVASQLPNQNGEVVTLTHKWSAKGTFGGSILGNDNLQGTATSSPAELSVWTLFTQATDMTTTTATTCLVEIEYIAVWDELIDQAVN